MSQVDPFPQVHQFTMRGPRSAGGWVRPAEMKRNRQCPECGQPVSRRRYRAALTAHEMLRVRDRLAALELDVADFCGRGVELARSLHAASHAGWNRVRLMRRSKRWLREGRKFAGSADGRRRPPPARSDDKPPRVGKDKGKPRMKL